MNNKKPMLEVGKRYKRRDGIITHPLVHNESIEFPFKDPHTGSTFYADGVYCGNPSCDFDLIEEYKDEPEVNQPILAKENKQLIQQLEKEITTLLINFERATGLYPGRIDVTAYVTRLDGPSVCEAKLTEFALAGGNNELR